MDRLLVWKRSAHIAHYPAVANFTDAIRILATNLLTNLMRKQTQCYCLNDWKAREMPRVLGGISGQWAILTFN